MKNIQSRWDPIVKRATAQTILGKGCCKDWDDLVHDIQRQECLAEGFLAIVRMSHWGSHSGKRIGWCLPMCFC